MEPSLGQLGTVEDGVMVFADVVGAILLAPPLTLVAHEQLHHVRVQQLVSQVVGGRVIVRLVELLLLRQLKHHLVVVIPVVLPDPLDEFSDLVAIIGDALDDMLLCPVERCLVVGASADVHPCHLWEAHGRHHRRVRAVALSHCHIWGIVHPGRPPIVHDGVCFVNKIKK